VNLRLSLVSPFFSLFLVGGLSAQLGGEVTGNSPRLSGLAGAGLSGGEDLAEAVHNPAMLGFVMGRGGARRIEFSLRGISNPLVGEAVDGSRFTSSDFTSLAPFAAAGMRLSKNWSASIQLLPTAGGSIRMNRLTQLNIAADETSPGSGDFEPRDRWVETENEVVQIALDPSIAWTPAPGLAFGLGASLRESEFQFASATEFGLDQLQGAPPPPLNGLAPTWGEFLTVLGAAGGRDLQDFQVEYDADTEAELLRLFKFGFAFEDDRGRRLGFWFRAPSNPVDIEGDVQVDLEADLGDIIRSTFGDDAETQSAYELRIREVRFPAQLGMAYMWPMGQRDRLHAQAVWTQWSKTFDGWTAELTEGSSDVFNQMIGGNGDTSFDLDNEWRDSWSVSFGWEHDWQGLPGAWKRQQMARWGEVRETWDMTSRIGVGWASNPVDGSVVPGLIPYNQWHLGGGLSLANGPLGGALHLGFVVALGETLQVGENEVLSDLSNDRYRQSNYALTVGYSLDF